MFLYVAGISNQGEPFGHDLLSSNDAREMKSKFCSETVVPEDHKLFRFCLK